MSLDIAGRPILSHGEFQTLMRGLDPEMTGTGTLQAWWAGEEPPAEEIRAALDVEARLAAQTPEAEQMIERALDRLEGLNS